ncbi:glycosyltransferase [Sphingomonas sp. LR60]|uniref:glycosyltransferase n=1 Tax=Sphingomonas sp. LR60 TaxID=3050233 RepID=UPI002FE1EBEE
MSDAAGARDAPPAMAICVPARNEAARLPRLFEALERLAVPAGTTVHVCVLLDTCTDRSAEVAMAYAGRASHRVHVASVGGSAANAGIARHAAMTLGIAAVPRGGDILLSTDADSWPGTDWLLATVAALDAADLVAGDVQRRAGPQDRAQDRIERYYARLYALRRRIDPLGWEACATHHHASGANMAMRVDTYKALGGFAPVASGEDARLLDDASRAGLRVRRDAASIVHTSARRHGRAVGGLATALQMLDRTGCDGVRVTDPDDQLWQYRHHVLARRAFAASDLSLLVAPLRLSLDHLRGVARDCPNAEAFAMRVVPEAPAGMRQVSLATAERTLAALIDGTIPAQAA